MPTATTQTGADMQAIPERLCECGCGAPAPLAKRTNARLGHTRGKPLRFVSGHNSKGSANLSRYESRDGGYSSPCWFWLGALSRKGYGRVQVDGVHRPAHRAVYEALYGPVPKHLHLDHLCSNKSCVNPAHMEPVTPAENNRRKQSARELLIRMIEA